ncbi:hypothetical protein L1987_14722 [Smallanthus sonchifolius]|uniref:Uncharacterized protein n=1 Tax=Smallanthus sonchifolius TaxID=185202 RepID=A0ACB9J553_9ASTR|nr:hypothetical protein L1987_14722 [Smallanthus sonchifolius]
MDGHDQRRSSVHTNAVVATVGLLSAALGFAVEATKLQLDEVKDISGRGCTYPSHSAPTALGVVAVVVGIQWWSV